MNVLSASSLSLVAALLAAPVSAQQPGSPNQGTGPNGFIRCATPPTDPVLARSLPQGDCSASSTNPTAAYANRELVEITVVFHVIRTGLGDGDVSDALIESQVDILNEDFRALVGTPGGPGTDTRIRFKLAEVDPMGNPTTGITRHDDTLWYADVGSYWDSIAWDPTRYMNVYTMGAPASNPAVLGYVPFLPQTGGTDVGMPIDRVVVLNTSIGRNSPNSPYDQGRTLTHEVGHYLGLEHTFNGGCDTGNCYTSGDLICDTNAESDSAGGCDIGKMSCGDLDPIHNYMNYSNDTCMHLFTEEQSRRMRCTLDFWRNGLAQPVDDDGIGENFCDPSNPNSTGASATLTATGSNSISANDLEVHAEDCALNATGFFVVSDTQAFVPNAGNSQGNLCLGGSIGRYLSQIGNTGSTGTLTLVVDVNAIPQPTSTIAIQPGETWNFQAWFRDANPNATSNFTDGYSITFQ